MKIIIDPFDDILYKSFYIYGLEQLFGSRYVRYDAKCFSSLSAASRDTRSMRFIIDEGNTKRRYMISCNDSYEIIPELYEWCDVYGSVNANFEKTPYEYQNKLVSLCPSFAVNCWSKGMALFHALRGLPRSQFGLKKHFGKYKRMLQRQEYSSYCVGHSEENYLFMCSTLWTNDEWNKNDETVNLSRARFVRAGRSIEGILFEGGFVPSATSSNELFKDCLCERCSSLEWMQKTQKSVCVFNTPAYWQCHGWKLGEYMALGKAIVTTPLSNDLPAPLSHGVHVHVTENNQDAMRDSILFINNHSEYRQRLENNIYAYWQEFGTPKASLHLLGIR